MPIQFPRPTGVIRFDHKAAMDRFGLKSFAAVPAPNMGQPGFPAFVSPVGWSLNPGLSVGKAVNVTNFSDTYTARDSTARPNPAATIFKVYDESISYDRGFGKQNERITGGITRDSTGAPLGSCNVHVFRTSDDILVATTTSDAVTGAWTAYPNVIGPYYFVMYKAGSPDLAGTSKNDKSSTQFTPGQ